MMVASRGTIAFLRLCGFEGGIYQIDVSHQIEHRLSNRYQRVYSLSYSPLGVWLVLEALERGTDGFFSRVYAFDLNDRREYVIAPGYVSYNGTPLDWLPNGVTLGLRRMLSIGGGQESVRVNLADGEVFEAANVRISNTVVDRDMSADGMMVRSQMEHGIFNLYVYPAYSRQRVQITHDRCIERYPRWQPR